MSINPHQPSQEHVSVIFFTTLTKASGFSTLCTFSPEQLVSPTRGLNSDPVSNLQKFPYRPFMRTHPGQWANQAHLAPDPAPYRCTMFLRLHPDAEAGVDRSPTPRRHCSSLRVLVYCWHGHIADHPNSICGSCRWRNRCVVDGIAVFDNWTDAT